jgi:hypothetical protein
MRESGSGFSEEASSAGGGDVDALMPWLQSGRSNMKKSKSKIQTLAARVHTNNKTRFQRHINKTKKLDKLP